LSRVITKKLFPFLNWRILCSNVFQILLLNAEDSKVVIDQGLVIERDIVVVPLVVQVVLVIRVEHLRAFNHHLGYSSIHLGFNFII
jgi:hypothetical protein